jgi:putative transposase
MKRKRFTEEQIIGVLKEYAAGASMHELSRRHGVAENTLYRWKAKFGNMEVDDAKRLRELEAENAKLKRLLADAMLDKAALKELLSKKW